MLFTARITALTGLALAGCIPSIVVGDSPQDDPPDGTTGTTTGAPHTTGEAPTTTEPLPAVCGDGLVGPGEVCDDGNDEPNDGCDPACARTGRVLWTTELAGVAIKDMALDPQGRILVSGWQDSTALLIALAPDGAELWRKSVPGSGELEIDPAGRIFVGTLDGEVFALTPDIKPLWSFEATLPEGVGDAIIGLAVTADALFSGAMEGGPVQRLAVRRHHLTTGAVEWETRTPDGVEVFAEDLAVHGQGVVAVGQIEPTIDTTRSMLAVFAADGALVSTELADDVTLFWTAAAPTAGGGLVMAALGLDATFHLRRLAPDRQALWSSALGGTPDTWPLRLAAATDERIAVVGHHIQPLGHGSVVRLLDGAGATLWSSVFASPLDAEDDFAVAVAFGPDLLVAAGHVQISSEPEDPTPTWRGWVRRFALD